MVEWSNPSAMGVCPGDSATKFRELLGLDSHARPTGTIIVSGTSRDVEGLLGGGIVQSMEMTTIEEGDTFLGVDLVDDPESVIDKIKRKGYYAFDDGAGIEVPELNASMYVCEDEIQSVCWTLPVPERES